MIRRAVVIGLGVAATLSFSGCALHDPYQNKRDRGLLPPVLPLPAALGGTRHAGATAGTQAPPAATGAPAQSTTTASGALVAGTAPGTPGTARYAIYQFALAYGNVSAAGLPDRNRTLAALSTLVLAQTFQAPAPKVKYETLRALPNGAQMVAHVVSIDLSPAQGTYQHAFVVLQQQLRRPGTTPEPPFTTTFDVDALLIGSQWRIATFTPQQ
jgi:hypothetical protein